MLMHVYNKDESQFYKYLIKLLSTYQKI